MGSKGDPLLTDGEGRERKPSIIATAITAIKRPETKAPVIAVLAASRRAIGEISIDFSQR